jgi:hypothetical protein
MKLSDEIKKSIVYHDYFIKTIDGHYHMTKKESAEYFLPKIEAFEKALEELLYQGVCSHYNESCHTKCRINFDYQDCAVIKAKGLL